MGIKTLISQPKRKNHKQVESTNSKLSSLWFQPKSTPSYSISNDTRNAKKSTPTIDSMLLPVSVSISEIKWTMKVVQSHFSLR